MQAHAEPLLSHEAVLAAAIRRYERLWLPLLAAHGRDGGDGAGLAAPLDIAWVWWCHSLAPHPYRKVRCECFCRSLWKNMLNAAGVPHKVIALDFQVNHQR